MNEEEEQHIREKLKRPIKEIRSILKRSIENTPSHLRGILIDDYDFYNILDIISSYLEFDIGEVISIIWASIGRESDERKHNMIKAMIDGVIKVGKKEE